MINSSIWDRDTGELQWQNIVSPSLNLGEYIVFSHPTPTTIILSGATLTPNEFVDSVIGITLNGICEYAVIKEHTEDTLILDDDLTHPDPVGKTLRILNTTVVTDIQLNTLIALNTTNGPMAILLPKSRNENERKFIHTYIEVSGDYICPIVCRETDRQAGAKSGYLQYKYEGVRLHTHSWNVAHWDIIQVYGVKRYATGYWGANDSIVALNFSNIIAAKIGANIVTDSSSRFAPIVKDGVNGIQYISLLPRKFSCKLVLTVEKTGSTGEATIGFAKYDYSENTTILLDSRLGYTLFGGGDGLQSVSVIVPVDLNFGDELYVVASKTAGTLSVKAGSSLEVLEY
ncbi:MAG: hypothetical protein AB7V16_06950 [Vulcanibacillus sp.]